MRVSSVYEVYNRLCFVVPTGFVGDCYDRYLVRIEEMRQSVRLIYDSLCELAEFLLYTPFVGVSGFTTDNNFYRFFPSKGNVKYFMESLIYHFKLVSESIYFSRGDASIFVEAPKGEFGVVVSSAGNVMICRCRIRAPGFFHLQGLEVMANDHLLADVVTVVGTQDIVFGEIDR